MKKYAIIGIILLIAYYSGGDKIIHHPSRAQRVATAIAYAKQQLGKPYRWGGNGPNVFDCSGLTQHAWQTAGIKIPRTSQDQWAQGTHVSTPKPGDLVFFHGYLIGGEKPPGHVGLVIGKGLMIEAYATGYPVKISHYGAAAGRPVWGYTDPTR